MPSQSLARWRDESKKKLDEFENAHHAVSGGRSNRGRRYLTEQLNHAYLVVLAAHFQKVCRDLHTEATSHLMNAVVNRDLRQVFLSAMTQSRKLDSLVKTPAHFLASRTPVVSIACGKPLPFAAS